MEKKEKRMRVNLIDLLVIVIAVIMVVTVALKMTGHMGPAASEVGTDIIYTVKTPSIDRAVYESIENYIQRAKAAGNPGDRLMANGALVDGYITQVTATTHVNYAANDQGQVVRSEEEGGRLDLIFTIQAHVPNNIKTDVGTQEVRVGKNHIVKTTHFELTNGTVQSCEWAGGTGAGF